MKKSKKFTLTEHLEELRRRAFICITVVAAASIICYTFVDKLLPYIVKPVGKLVFIQPLEAFITYIKLTVLCGVFVSLPVLLYQIWAFVSVGLKQNERRYILFYGPVSFIFFLLGAVFAYTMIVPNGLRFLLSFGSIYLEPMISVSNYISFLIIIVVSFGVAFELPIAILFLSKIGLVNAKLLRKNRRIAIALIFIIAAILTPPDVFTQVMLAVPLICLYEFSILLSHLAAKGKA